MAQLATCPHCDTELLLPAFENGPTQRACPNCGERFDTSEAATRFVAEAIPADGGDLPEVGMGPAGLKQTLPAYSGTTLAAFLRDAEQKTRGPGHTAEDPPHDDSQLSSRQTVSDFDMGQFDPAPPEHGGFDDEGVSPSTGDEDLVDFNREWDAEDTSLRDDLEHSDSFDIPREDEFEPAEDFGAQFGKFTLPDDIDDVDQEDPRGSGFGAGIVPLAGEGTLKDFTVPDLDGMEIASRAEEEVSPAGQGGSYPTAQDAAVATAVPIPARTVARRRRSNGGSGMGTLIKIVLGGIVGIWLAYPIALWIAAHALGRTEEPLALAQYYPNVMLPERFQHGDVAKGPGGGQQFSAPPTERKEDSEKEAEVLPPVEPAGSANRFDVSDGPEVVAAPVIELKEVPKYNLTDLEQATAQAVKLSPELIEGSFAQQELRKIKGGAYSGIANLAHVLACLDPAVSSHSIADTARAVFPPMFADPSDRAEISEISSHWLKSSARKNSGVLFNGTPDEGVLKGSVTEYQFQTPQGNNLTVLVPEKLDATIYGSAVTVGVVGEILYDAPVQVEGYTGDAKQAIWGAYLFPIGAP